MAPMYAFAQPLALRVSSTRLHQRAGAHQSRRLRAPSMSTKPIKTLVTGASGRTGRLALERLLARPEYDGVGMVRSLDKGKEAGFAEEALVVADVSDRDGLKKAMDGVDALIVLTSAVPVAAPVEEGQPPRFIFPEDGFPEQVDYEGGVNQIEAAKEAGVRHVVFVGSMGATDDNSMLNRVGPNGFILRWKRKAEQYLIDSGLEYTIINPGGLLNEPGSEREIVVSNSDLLYKVFETPAIPRADVAELTVQAVLHATARNKAMDVVTKPPGDGTTTKDFEALFATAGSEL